MDELSRLAEMTEILGAAGVIGGVFFALVQARQARKQRREFAAIELLHFFGSRLSRHAVTGNRQA